MSPTSCQLLHPAMFSTYSVYNNIYFFVNTFIEFFIIFSFISFCSLIKSIFLVHIIFNSILLYANCFYLFHKIEKSRSFNKHLDFIFLFLLYLFNVIRIIIPESPIEHKNTETNILSSIFICSGSSVDFFMLVYLFLSSVFLLLFSILFLFSFSLLLSTWSCCLSSLFLLSSGFEATFSSFIVIIELSVLLFSSESLSIYSKLSSFVTLSIVALFTFSP